MKIDRYEIAALRDRARAAQREVNSVLEILDAKRSRISMLRDEIEAIDERIEILLGQAEAEIPEHTRRKADICVKCGTKGCREHGITFRA